MKPKLITATGVIAVLVVVGFFFTTGKTNQDIVTIDDRILRFLSSEFTGLNHNGKPIFKIKSTSQFEDKWYVVTIDSLSKTAVDVPVYFLLTDENNTLHFILGPDTHFTEAEMLKYNVPDSIIKEFSDI